MDFYLIAADGGHFHFPMNPERVTMQAGAKMQSFEIINLGNISIPKGREPVRFTWEGRLPGEVRKDAVFVKDWKPPLELANQLIAWSDAGTKVRLLVTETAINHEVYISTFTPTWSGGHGDIQYNIEFSEARETNILTEDEWKARQGIPIQGQQSPAPASYKRPAPPPPKTYTVKSGDSLYAIAKQTLGDGSRWKEIYNANVAIIGKNPNLIRPGQSFRIPT